MAVLIRRATVSDATSSFHLKTVDILIDNEGIIRSIGTDMPDSAGQVIEAEGLHVSRGWTDIFADYREPGFEHKETIASGLTAAAAGGFSHVCTLPNTQPTVSSKSVVQYILKQAEGNPVTIHPLGAVSKDIEGKALAEMLDMHTHGALAFTDGWKPVQNANVLLKALEYVKAFSGTILQIPCDAALSAGGLMHEGPESTRLGMPGIPVLAETLQLYRDIELLRYTGSRLHVTGISAAESVAMIRKAKAEGLAITCSVTPYHLLLNDEVMRSYSSAYKVMPPIRSEADRRALIEGIKDGTIDCITSHHRPQEWDAKAKEFEYAADGMNVQELAFSIAYTALKGHVDETTIIAALADNPARIFGIQNGSIREGEPADISLFRFSGHTKLNHMRSLSANNPFLNQELAGQVIGIVKGNRALIHQA